MATQERIPSLAISENVPLSEVTRFGIGGPARHFGETADEAALTSLLQSVQEPWVLIGGGTNVIASDAGFPGLVVRYTGSAMVRSGVTIRVQAGASLQDLVDYAIAQGLRGLQTMTGIPGSVGGAIYGNAGAYGHSIMEFVARVRFFDGEGVREFENEECQFRYRESVFKRNKNWIIFSVELALEEGDSGELSRTANEIRKIRDEKYPPSMKCAGSIFKNLMLAELPESVRRIVPEKVVREGKVPSAWFLEQVGAKGMKAGGIHVADYHANLIFNTGDGTSAELRSVIAELKARVEAQFGFAPEEEVQYVGF
jgi:UDP-N-acetylmuramate dehydrogenase